MPQSPAYPPNAVHMTVFPRERALVLIETINGEVDRKPGDSRAVADIQGVHLVSLRSSS
jgi:hypothetical protein